MPSKYFHFLSAWFLIAGASLLMSCGKKPASGMLVLTETVSELPPMNFASGDAWRYLPKARLVAINPKNTHGSAKVLTADFYSALSPDISVDGSSMVFAAQKKETDPWQIWEMDLSGSEKPQGDLPSGKLHGPGLSAQRQHRFQPVDDQ